MTSDPKLQPALSTDCEAGEHGSCEGEESSLWADGDLTMQPCSCDCHGGKSCRVAIPSPHDVS